MPAFVETTLNEVTWHCESLWTNKDAAQSMYDAVFVVITMNVFLPMIVITLCYALIINALHFNKTTSSQTFDPRDLQSKKNGQASNSSVLDVLHLLFAIWSVHDDCRLE